MNKLIKSALLGVAALGAVGAQSLVDHTAAFAQTGATVGTVRGVIRDKSAGDNAIGATVVATSPALQGEQVVITDENGQYFLTSLPPGLYTLTVYYENKTFSRGNVLVQLGKEVVINVAVDPTAGAAAGKGPGEIIEIQGNTPIVDQGSTKTGITITDDYTRNIPTGRTFGGVLESSAGSQTDTYGTSISGATSAENTYVVEGINTTDTAFGGISSNLPTEFLQETEVITGGYNAEFGRATGGIVNVVTKSGSNTFHGSVFGYWTPGQLVANAKTIVREGSSIDSETNLNYRYDVGAELGGPIIKDKLWFHLGFNPSAASTDVTRFVSSLQDRNDDGSADVDPATGFSIRNRIAGSERNLNQKLNTYFFTGKINGAIGQNNQFQLSVFGNPRSGDAVSGNIVRDPGSARYKLKDGAYDVSGKWTSKFNEGKTQLDAVLGFHRGFDATSPIDAAHDVGLVTYRYQRSLNDFASLEGDSISAACADGGTGDQFQKIVNCPVTSYRSQGLGFVEDRTNDRASAVVSATQRVKLAGYHEFKLGVDLDMSTYDSTRGYSGGYNALRLAAGDAARFRNQTLQKIVRNIEPTEDLDVVAMSLLPTQRVCLSGTAVCETQNDVTVSSNNRSYAGYIQDSWQIRPNFTVNAGARFEQQNGYVAKELQGLRTPDGEITPNRAYQLNQVAPRLGVIFDPTQEGKSKIFAHWGRFYENVPMDINVRAFGGEITQNDFTNSKRLAPGGAGYDPNCNPDFMPGVDIGALLQGCSRANIQDRGQLGGATEYVSPGIKGQYTQELVLGSEYEFVNNLKFGLSYIHRSLPTIIEDLSTDGGANYLITNPGQDLSGKATELRAQAATLMASADPQQVQLGKLYASRADQLDSVSRFDKPVRNYDALQFQATQRFTKNSLLLASYTYSVSKGNYPGLFSTETGQLDPNLTSLYDLPDLMANRYGNLGLDRPHNLKVDGFYAFDLKKAGIVTIGASVRAQSGIPRNTLAAHPIYGADESYLLGRGDIGRSPVTAQVDTHFAYGYQLNKTTRLEAFIRVFNITDQQEQLDVDSRYTVDSANPIVGGDKADLDHSKTIDAAGSALELNASPTPNKNYGKLDTRQGPRNVQLGFRLTF